MKNVETQKTTTTTKAPVTAPKKGKRLNAGFLSIRNDKGPGGTAEGFFLDVVPLLTEAGEIRRGNFDQELYVLNLRDTKGEILTYWCDAGLRGSLKMAKVKPEQYIFIEHTGVKEIEQGKVQTYEVFGSEQ